MGPWSRGWRCSVQHFAEQFENVTEALLRVLGLRRHLIVHESRS
jgi:hypothetical protein